MSIYTGTAFTRKKMSKKEGSEVAIIAVLADGRMGGRANSSNTKILLFAIL